MKGNKIYIIIISVLLIILLGIMGLIILKKEPTTPKENKPEINPEEEIVYACEIKQGEEYVGFRQYAIENVIVKDNRVLSIQTGIKQYYNSKEIYENIKASDVTKTDEYNDSELMIIKMNKTNQDYTKDDTGKEINVTFDEYQQFLSELGYTCTKKS